MITKRTLCCFTLAALLLLGLAAGVCAQPQEPARTAPASNDMVTLDFKDIDLPDLIQTISELTGKNFLYDNTVKGKLTIISPERMTLDEAYQLFLTVLNVKGYTVVPSGKVNKIVPTKDAKESNLPTVIDGRGEKAPEQFVTRLIQLQNIDADIVASTVLAPLIPKTSNIVAYPPTNTLIITDSAANIERLARIIRELDEPSDLDMLEVIPLEFASAEEVAKVASQILEQGAAKAAKSTRRRTARQVKTAGEKEVSKIIPYARTNALVVMATEEDLSMLRELIEELDKKPARERSNINVVYLENADAETLAKTLNEILTGIKAKAKAANAQKPGQALLETEAVSITFDKPTNSLIINSSPEDFETLKGIITQLDIKRKQVYVEALILELSMDATQRLGASLQGAIDTGSDSAVFGTSNLNTGAANLGSLAPVDSGGIPGLLTQTIEGILLGGFFSPITTTINGEEVTVPALSALIDLSQVDADVNILSAPRLLTSDNEEAEIVVGANVPIITQRLTDATSLNTSVSVERQDVALTLRFTPQITEGDLVRLNVFQEITNISNTAVGDVEAVGPTLDKRLLRNTVLARNGQTIVLGGLIDTNVQERISKVPLLGDIPFLGWLFKRKSSTEEKTNLLVFINPTIIKNEKDLARVTDKNRGTAESFLTEKMRDSLPPEFFESKGQNGQTDAHEQR